MEQVLYQQINKDHAFWSEKRRHGQRLGGNTSGLLTHLVDGSAVTNILFDAGLGTIEGLCDLDAFGWSWPLDVFVTHAHADHHAELGLLAQQWCLRGAARRREPVSVRATELTLQSVTAAHARGFGAGRFLTACPIAAGLSQTVGIFRVTPVAVDHLPGAAIYVAEFGVEKILIGWDLKTLPDVAAHPVLQRPSLALIEANTWSAHARTGHTSVEELVNTGFLRSLQAQDAPGTRHGIYLVHYSGHEDSDGGVPDEELAQRLAREHPGHAGRMGVAARGQVWRFDLARA